jgi:hypothetical protein
MHVDPYPLFPRAISPERDNQLAVDETTEFIIPLEGTINRGHKNKSHVIATKQQFQNRDSLTLDTLPCTQTQPKATFASTISNLKKDIFRYNIFKKDKSQPPPMVSSLANMRASFPAYSGATNSCEWAGDQPPQRLPFPLSKQPSWVWFCNIAVLHYMLPFRPKRLSLCSILIGKTWHALHTHPQYPQALAYKSSQV